MGYYAHTTQSDFLILDCQKQMILEALRKKFPVAQNYSMDLDDFFSSVGLEYAEDTDGNIDDVWFTDGKYHQEDMEAFLAEVAPFVTAGSYLGFIGQDDSLWCYYFDGMSVKNYQGAITYPDMPSMDGPKKQRSDV